MTNETDRKLTLVKSEGMGDWYVIEWAEHDQRGWMEMREAEGYKYGAWCWSGRVADADVEGHASEMAAIADAIKSGGSASFRRCEAMRLQDGSYALSSPRNSQTPGVITAQQATHLTAEIERVLQRLSPSSPPEPTP